MSDEELIQRLGSQHTAAIARLNASNVIDDLKPCPSCREPLDHPSGDGCANMTAHKERAMSDDKELIARLRSKRQKGNRFDSLEYEAADRIEALTKERDTAREYAGEVRKREMAVEDARISATDKLATCEKYRDAYAEMGRIGTQAVRDLEAKLAKAVEALTPSGDTKAEYMGEFHFSQTMMGEDGDDVTVKTYVPWSTIKEIMKAIRVRATLAEIKGESQDGMV